jgi:siroheme synthase
MERLTAVGCEADKPVALIQSGTHVSQKRLEGTVNTIAHLAERRNFRSPTIIVVGEVVRLAKHLEWFGNALAGYTGGMGRHVSFSRREESI